MEIANRCERIVALLQLITNNNRSQAESSTSGARAIYAFSVADEILKFKKLMDEGIITAEEFQTQKQKLLSLDY